MRARVAIGVFIAWLVGLTAVYYAISDAWVQAWIWLAISLSGCLAMLAGVRLNRPTQARQWRLLAAGAVLLGVGDTVSLFLRDRQAADLQPLPVDLCYLGMFTLMSIGILALSRSRVPDRDRAGLLDALTLTAGVGLPFWIYLVAPRIAAADLSVIEAINVIGYPLGTLLLVAMVVRLSAGTFPNPALVLFSGGLYALAIGVVIYLMSTLSDTWRPGGPADLWWVAFYLGWGTAALHPSMVRLGEPRLSRSGVLTVQRFVLLALCALIPNGVLIGMALRGTIRYAGVVGFAGLVMVILVLSRLFGVLRRQWRVLGHERQLRRTGAQLLVATEIPAVERVVEGAVDGLLSGARHRTILALDDWPLDGNVSQICDPAEMPSWYATELADFPAVLSSPLLAGPDEDLGRLLVAADPAQLHRLKGVLEILAVQTALAVTRTRLSDEVARREAEVYFQNLVYHSSDVILIVDDSGVIRYRSPSAEHMFGEQTAKGRLIVDLVADDEREHAKLLMARIADGDTTVPNDLEWRMRSRAGRPLVIAASWRDLRSDASVGGFVITLRDVTEQRRLADELTFRAYHDPLTGLPNRAMFAREAENAVRRARADDTVVGVLFIDLDDFKTVNDTRGHLAGDQMLREVATRLVRAIRRNDLAARLGGDEFAVLLPGADGVEQIEAVAGRVVDALGEPMMLGGYPVDLSGSVGVATTADSHHGSLLHDADRALYRAKQDGKGRWRRHDPSPAR